MRRGSGNFIAYTKAVSDIESRLGADAVKDYSDSIRRCNKGYIINKMSTPVSGSIITD